MMMPRKTRYIALITALALMPLSLPASAQDAAATVTTAPIQSDAAPPAPAPATGPTITIPKAPDEMAPLVFSVWEQKAIEDARNARGMVRPPTEAELMRDLKLDEAEKVKPPPEKRYVSLGGIIYNSKDDWAIWLNGARVTPDALPKEALDLVVTREYIDIKWLDDYTNRIFPIRLRPHQRFNIDMRIFLPGQP